MKLLFKALDSTRLPHVSSPEGEARKLAVLRIAVGLLLAWRSGIVARDAAYYFDATSVMGRAWPVEAVAGWVQCLVALGLAFGVFPRTCAAFLTLTHAIFSVWTDTYNLGPMLLVPILGAIAVLDSGRFTLTGPVRPTPRAAEFRAAYLVLFLAYAGWSFQAVLYHVRDPYWIQGRTTEVMFINSYLSEFYPVFRLWERASPDTLRALSVVVGGAQTLFQIAMIPLIFSRWGAAYVRIWGWIFIGGSLLDLQLTLLPFVECVLWAMIFLSPRWFHTRPLAAASVADTSRANGSGLRGPATVYTAGYLVLSSLFFANAILTFTINVSIPRWINHPVLFYAGLVAPNVFNTQDLTMGDHWAVLTRTDSSRSHLVPFDGPDGERLSYLRSDLLYFANSLRWRREMIGVTDLAAFHRPEGRGYGYAYRVALYDHRRRGSIVPETYNVSVFRNYAADRSGQPVATCYAPIKMFEFQVTVAPGSAVDSRSIAAERSAD
jgi:hypothetical protein